MYYDHKQRLTLGFDGQPVSKAALRRVTQYQKQALASLTDGERGFCKLIGPVCLHAKVRYVMQPVMYIRAGLSYRLDILFRDYRLAVEIDGCSHLSAEARQADQEREANLWMAKAIKVIRFTNEDIAKRYMWVRVQTVKALVESPRGYKRFIFRYYNEIRDDALAKRQAPLIETANNRR